MDKLINGIKRMTILLGTVLSLVMIGMTVLLYFSVQWMFDTWSNLTMDELVFHLTAPLEGTNGSMIQEFLNVCVAPAVLVLLIMIILFSAWRKTMKYYLLLGCGIIVSVAFSGIVVHSAWNQLDAGNYVYSKSTYSTFIDDNYVNPTDVELDFPEQKRNLIYIFLESMEITYADDEIGGAFEENIIPELTDLAQSYEDFSGESNELNGGYAMPGATWTIGAMFSQTSGIPLNVSIDGNSMDTQDTFFAGAVTLGDVLEQAGYSQTLLIGSDATFGGRRLYFSEHGNYDILDYYYAAENGLIPEGYRVFWGYEDQKLFEFAKAKLQEISSKNEPFNFTLLTVDTHFEDGYLCERCSDDYGDNQYANVMACSSRQVAEFVEWIQNQEFYENTTIVIVGDHPTMDSDFCEDIEDDYVRKVYTAYINSAVDVEVNEKRNYTTFDMFPTTLASLGVEIEGERLGLGTNLFSDEQTLSERFGTETEKAEIEKKSKLMEELADLDVNKKELLIREGKIPTVTIQAEAYERDTGIIPVKVLNIETVQEDVVSVMAAVWTNEDQSDIQWMQLEAQEDGSYSVNINIAGFGYRTGEYYIHIYAIDGAGGSNIIGGTIGVVE